MRFSNAAVGWASHGDLHIAVETCTRSRAPKHLRVQLAGVPLRRHIRMRYHGTHGTRRCARRCARPLDWCASAGWGTASVVAGSSDRKGEERGSNLEIGSYNSRKPAGYMRARARGSSHPRSISSEAIEAIRLSATRRGDRKIRRWHKHMQHFANSQRWNKHPQYFARQSWNMTASEGEEDEAQKQRKLKLVFKTSRLKLVIVSKTSTSCLRSYQFKVPPDSRLKHPESWIGKRPFLGGRGGRGPEALDYSWID